MKMQKLDDKLVKNCYAYGKDNNSKVCVDYLIIPDRTSIYCTKFPMIDANYLDILNNEVRKSKSTIIRFIIDKDMFRVAL